MPIEPVKDGGIYWQFFQQWKPIAIRPLRTLRLMIISLEVDVESEAKYVREVENKKLKFSKSKMRKTYRRKSGRKDRHASKGDEKNEPVYTALVRKDNSDSFIPFLFSLKSVDAFALFKTKVLNACSASRTNAQLYYNHSDCKVTLNSATWESFVFFLKSRQDCTVTLQVETVSSAASAVLRTPGFSSQLSGPSTISNVPQQNVKNVLDMIIEKDWSGVFIQALPKKSREEAMLHQASIAIR